MGIKGELDKAEFLADRVDAYLAAMGFEAEKNRRFHLTLGRVRSENGLQAMLTTLEKMHGKDKLRSFRVEHFHLVESVLGAAGPKYEIMEKYTLNG